MKKLIEVYLRENHSNAIKELAVIKACQLYNITEEYFTDLLEEVERELVLYEGYSLNTRQELYTVISDIIDDITEEYANKILDTLNSL